MAINQPRINVARVKQVIFFPRPVKLPIIGLAINRLRIVGHCPIILMFYSVSITPGFIRLGNRAAKNCLIVIRNGLVYFVYSVIYQSPREICTWHIALNKPIKTINRIGKISKFNCAGRFRVESGNLVSNANRWKKKQNQRKTPSYWDKDFKIHILQVHLPNSFVLARISFNFLISAVPKRSAGLPVSFLNSSSRYQRMEPSIKRTFAPVSP